MVTNAEVSRANRDDVVSKLTKLSFFAIPYCVFVSTLYLCVFWSTVGINPFDFGGFSDILPKPTTLLILVAPFGIFIAISLVGPMHFSGIASTARLQSWRFVALVALFTLVPVVMGIYDVLRHGVDRLWPAVAIALSIPLSIVFAKVLKDKLGLAKASALVALLIYVPMLDVVLAHGTAVDTRRGRHGAEVDLKLSDIEGYGSDKPSEMRFIGRLGSFFFFTTSRSLGALEVVPDDKVRRLVFKPRPYPSKHYLQLERWKDSDSAVLDVR